MVKTSKHFKNIAALSFGLVFGALAFMATVVATSSIAYAADDAKPKDNICKTENGKQVNPDPTKPCIPDPNELKSTPDSAAKTCTGGDCSGLITKYVNPFIKLLSVLVGILVVIGVASGGVQISAAGGDPSKVVAGRKRITNAIIALLTYLFLFAFLQWLVPGGIV
jgi:hypothetical protein